MSEDKFDFGAMVSDQMKTFRPGFKFPGSFNDFKSVESDPDKRRAALKAASEQEEEGGVDAEATKNPLDSSIRAAFEAGDPIEGKVEKEVKGGYEVTVKGQRAFCPFSQIDRFRKPGAVYVGETLLFQVQEYSADDRGVNLVVSRRAELELEQQALKEELRDSLEEGQTLNGQVTKVLPFGAFVNIGGMEGLVPVREISWDKVMSPENYVKPGDYVTVKVLSVDWERDRISLSIRECQSRPLKPRKGDSAEPDAPSIDLATEMARVNADGAKFSSGAFDAL
ncbi:MAG: S1 RNA-binding domain-containing protein [Verrucomicrobiota bacterium]|nr:S1 RNA-binding domain-containing protein [Verrucomicrobiota bacterium]MDY5596102.1 S1 RNA-binding domain-containing protein [Kiritimatiellia bacterium]